jgi:hypothetical protein
MLDFGAPAREVKVDETTTVEVLADSSDKTQFYYLPNYPRIALTPDGSPSIRLLIFRKQLDEVTAKEEDAVGFLSLDVDLRYNPEQIEKARSVIALEDRLNDKPKLTPIFFRNGTVKLMLLDAVTPEPGADRPAPAAQPSEFVAKIMGAGSPSLYGDNRAIFQASLSKKGAAALSGALDGVTPIGVVYSLTFAGLQPAFHIRAKVDWQKIMDHFSEEKHLDLIFYESDIQKVIDKFREDRVIELEETIEGVGAEAMDSEREQAMTIVRQMIFEKFFEATFKRETAAGDDVGSQVAGTVQHLAKNAITLGMGYTYKRKEVHVEELRTLELDFSARKAAERTIYPQAHMYNLLKDAAVGKDRLVTLVDGSDNIWNSQPFEVHTTASWDTDGIAGVSVDIEYDDPKTQSVRTWDAFLSKDKPVAVHRDWMDRTSGNSYRYKYEVVFQDSVPGPRPKIDSGKQLLTQQGTVLVIHPRELYDTIELEVCSIPKFPFERWPAVQAILRYRTEDGSFQHFEDGVLKTGAERFTTRFRVDKPVTGIREVSLKYLGTGGQHYETGWMPMPQDQWVVDDPYGGDLVVRAVVAGKRDNIANLLVDLLYEDPANGIVQDGSFSFDPDNINKPQSWTVFRADPTKSRYRYRMTLVTKDGNFLQTGWISTDAPSIPVGEVYVRRLGVEVETGALGPGVEKILVDLAYAQGSVNQQTRLTLLGGDRGQWQVDLQDASKRDYQMTITWVKADGFDIKVGPKMVSDTYVVIPGSPPEHH